MVFSDAFNTGSIDSRWVLRDPKADITFTATGSHLEMDIPAGEHDLWVPPDDNAGRLVQPISDVDFGVTVKFDSVPSSGYQMQGIVIESGTGAGNEVIRAGTHSDGSNVHVFLARPPSVHYDNVENSIVSEVWLRMVRDGFDYTYSWSIDGTSFTTAFTVNIADFVVNNIGIYGGTAVSNPAYITSADYIEFDSDPFTADLIVMDPLLMGAMF